MAEAPKPRRDPGQPVVRGDIDAQHASIRTLLDRLEATTRLPDLAEQLGALRQELVEHFESEEAEDGLHRLVEEMAPRHLTHVQRLLAEHEEILGELDRIAGDIEDILECRTPEICTAVRTLVTRLREHEAQENRIFDDAVYTDLGGEE